MRLFALGLLFYPPNHHYEKQNSNAEISFQKYQMKISIGQ